MRWKVTREPLTIYNLRMYVTWAGITGALFVGGIVEMSDHPTLGLLVLLGSIALVGAGILYVKLPQQSGDGE